MSGQGPDIEVLLLQSIVAAREAGSVCAQSSAHFAAGHVVVDVGVQHFELVAEQNDHSEAEAGDEAENNDEFRRCRRRLISVQPIEELPESSHGWSSLPGSGNAVKLRGEVALR